VLEVLNSGELSSEHYENYRRIKEESEFHELSHAEKRKKDRDFGRYIKSAKNDLGDD
jgi:ribosome biogenesis GTPase